MERVSLGQACAQWAQLHPLGRATPGCFTVTGVREVGRGELLDWLSLWNVLFYCPLAVGLLVGDRAPLPCISYVVCT